MSQDSNTENNSRPRLSLKKKGEILKAKPELSVPGPVLTPSGSEGKLTLAPKETADKRTTTPKLNLKKTEDGPGEMPVEGLLLGEMDPFSSKSLSRVPFAPSPPTETPLTQGVPPPLPKPSAANRSSLPPPLPPPPIPPTTPSTKPSETSGHKKAFTLLLGLLLLFLIGGGGIYLLYIGLSGTIQPGDNSTPVTETRAPAPIPVRQIKSQISSPTGTSPAPTPEALITAGTSGPRTTQTSSPSGPTPDRQVTDWVESMKPQSVARNRMMLGGQRYDLGSLVQEDLQIRWIEVDMDLGVLVFEDARGVRYEKDF